MLQANLSLTFDPAWPWSLPGVGIPALLAAAGVLAALTIWTYLSAKGATWRRVGLILVLRLIALAIACFLVLRPTFAYEEPASVVPGKLLLVMDYSESMKITDEFDNLSRPDMPFAQDQLRIVLEPLADFLLGGDGRAVAAAAEVLGALFPEDDGRYWRMATDAALSRLYGGIHFRSDCDAGLRLGRQVGRLVIAHG